MCAQPVDSKTPPLKPELVNFLKSEKAIIVDSAESSRRRLGQMLISLGMLKDNVLSVQSYGEALGIIDEKKPKILISDYELGNKSGFDLMQAHKEKMKGQKDLIGVLVTANSSQSTVARAAEEDVDGFILKPYTLNSLRDSLVECITAKLFPSPYHQKIELGKNELFTGNIEQAIKVLQEAKALDPSPTLAMYYIAQAKYMQEMMGEAVSSYEECLKLNNIHYKSLVGLYELFMKKKDQDKAYVIMKKIMEYYPANSVRMTSAVRLAVMTKNYQDIEGYYASFVTIDVRTKELVSYVCSGLVTLGMHYCRTNEKTRALDVLNKAAVSCAGQTIFLRKIVELMADYGCGASEVGAVMKRFPPGSEKEVDYEIAQIWQELANGKNDVAYKLATQLKSDSNKTIEKHHVIIEAYLRSGKKDLASELIEDGLRRWPKEDVLSRLKARLTASVSA